MCQPLNSSSQQSEKWVTSIPKGWTKDSPWEHLGNSLGAVLLVVLMCLAAGIWSVFSSGTWRIDKTPHIKNRRISAQRELFSHPKHVLGYVLGIYFKQLIWQMSQIQPATRRPCRPLSGWRFISNSGFDGKVNMVNSEVVHVALHGHHLSVCSVPVMYGSHSSKQPIFIFQPRF